MKTIRYSCVPLLAILLFSPKVFSQKVGSTSMQFLKVMPCARATAMGDAYSVLASGAEAVFWNPAGVALSDRSEASLTYLKWIFDTQQGAASFSMPFGNFGSVGVQMQYVDFGEIAEALWESPYKDDLAHPGLTGRTFHPFTYLIGLTYASQITEKFATGISVKYARESLYDGQAHVATGATGETSTVNTWGAGFIFDFGLYYNTGFRTVRLGASMQNFGANVRYASEASPVPIALRVGIAADLMGTNALLMPTEEGRCTVAFDLFQPNDFEQQAHAGVEYVYGEVVAVRAGYKINYDADGFTAGVGLRQMIAQTRFSFDYSYGVLNYNLGNVHRISLGVGF